jgi:hypothetical protein
MSNLPAAIPEAHKYSPLGRGRVVHGFGFSPGLAMARVNQLKICSARCIPNDHFAPETQHPLLAGRAVAFFSQQRGFGP